MIVRILVVAGAGRGRTFDFEEPARFLVGRAPEAHLCVDGDPFFSRHHFVILIDPPRVRLVDLGSRNGTFLNDDPEPCTTAELGDGDVIRGGETALRVDILDPLAGTDHEVYRSAEARTLDDILGPRDPVDGGEPIVCIACGQPAATERRRAAREQTSYLCPGCFAGVLRQPALLDGYTVVRKLREGGMGAVYLARHDASGELRALKVILPRNAMSRQARQRFVREASTQAALHHPRIVRVHELAEVREGMFCMAMEYLDGGDADGLLQRSGGRLAPPVAAELIAHALEGLEFAHQQGVVHRDLKEANILLAGGGGLRPKISDFGLAKSYEGCGASDLTRTGDVMGTIPYMPPEQILDFRSVKPSADIYSMGATLYRLVTGSFPHDYPRGCNPFLVVLEHDIVPPEDRGDLPPGLAAVIRRALARDPERRFRSAGQMRAILMDAT